MKRNRSDNRLSYRPTKEEKRAVIFMILPALAEYLLSHTFSLVDAAMLGHTEDSVTVLASVGLTSPLTGLLANLLSAFNVGTTAAVAWFLGSKNPKDAKATARQTLTVSALLGFVISLIFTVFSPQIVGFMGDVEDSVRQGAIEYFAIISMGLIFQSITLNISASFRGAGITKYTMIYNLAANASNVGLNYLFIYGGLGVPAMGLRGAAIATTLSKVLGFLLAFGMIVLKKSPVQVSLKQSFLPRKFIMRRVLPVGIAASLEQIVLQGGNVLFTKTIAQIPKVHFSAFTITNNISGFVWNVSGACAVASTTRMGLHLGEGREDKCIAFTRYAVRLSVTWTIGVSICLILLRSWLPSLFVNDPDVIQTASILLPIAALYAIPVAIHQPLGGALRGAGDTVSPLIAALCSLWLFRVFLGWILVQVLDLGIFFAQIAVAGDQLARATVDWILFRKGSWRKRFQPKAKKE